MTIREMVTMQALHDDTIFLMSQGAFYRAYNEGAEALSAVCGYKVREVRGVKVCGFPVGYLARVVERLKECAEAVEVRAEGCHHVAIRIINLTR